MGPEQMGDRAYGESRMGFGFEKGRSAHHRQDADGGEAGKRAFGRNELLKRMTGFIVRLNALRSEVVKRREN